MPRYLPEAPATESNTKPGKSAILLVNLGTPDAPTAPAVRKYLGEFLSDPRVVELPKWLWWPILHGIILRVRPAKSAAKYASIWQPQGSPLRTITAEQTELLASHFPETEVRFAMRYGQPSIPAVLSELKAAGCDRVLVVPMYPQYAASTTATVMDQVAGWMQHTRNQPAIRSVRSFCNDDGYINALATTVLKHWEQRGMMDKDARLLMSFHGLPERSIRQGDPYYFECQQTCNALTKRLGLQPGQVVLTFQSRFGKETWLQPYTAPTVAELARQGVRRLDVICPGFVADCLETLEEIAQEVRNDFLTAGGQTFHYIPCLNKEPAWITALANLCRTHKF